MRSVIFLGLVVGVIGLVVGYLIFGRGPLDNLVPIADIFRPAENVFAEIGQSLAGFKEMRRNILISGGAGVLVGAIFGVFVKRR